MAMRFPSGSLVLPAVAITILSAISSIVAQEPAAIPVEKESHHQIVFENSYVRVLFVEIPPHETTLLHHHVLPYISIPPGGAETLPVQAGTGAQQVSRVPRIAYAVGGFSHAVNNPSDVTLRNIAVELIRPQGRVRNRCEEVVHGQPLVDCDMPSSANPALPLHYALFETDEILVRYWELGPNSTIAPADSRHDILVGGVSGVVKAEGSGRAPDDPVLWAKGGLLALPAGSKAVFTFGRDGGHFVEIVFKDSAPMRDSE